MRVTDQDDVGATGPVAIRAGVGGAVVGRLALLIALSAIRDRYEAMRDLALTQVHERSKRVDLTSFARAVAGLDHEHGLTLMINTTMGWTGMALTSRLRRLMHLAI